MCSRMTLKSKDLGAVAAELEAELDERDRAGWEAREHVSPTDTHPILVDRGRRKLVPTGWGFLVEGRSPLINARAETLAERFRGPLARGRCIVPADGFFEWTGPERRRRPVWFHSPTGGLLLLAGLWELGKDGQPLFVVITTEPNALVRPVHDRMPVLLDAARAREWLASPKPELLRPAPEEMLIATAQEEPQLDLFK
jgi:putative SOS response-associated peptidase YedK